MYENTHNSKVKFIAIDWGTVNFRAYVVDNDGNIKERTKVPYGTNRLKDEDYAWIVRKLLGKWMNKYPGIPLMMCGMVGTDEGWQPVEPLAVPVGLKGLAEHIEKIVNHRLEREVYIVPGVSLAHRSGVIDELHGEEVQVLGAIQSLSKTKNHKICLPGNLTKWVDVKDNTIQSIHTIFTGELYNLLTHHFAEKMSVEVGIFDLELFNQGIEQSQKNTHWMQALSQLRSKSRDVSVSNSDLNNFLSGYLIGQELRWATEFFPELKSLILIASARLTQLYEVACQHYKIEPVIIKSEQATVDGLLSIFNLLPANH